MVHFNGCIKIIRQGQLRLGESRSTEHFLISVLHFEFLLWKCMYWTHLKSGRSRLVLVSMTKNISYKLSSSCGLLEKNRISWTSFSVKLEYFVLINLVKGSGFVLLFGWTGLWKEGAVSLVESPFSLLFCFLISSNHKALIQDSETLSKRGRRSVTLSPNARISPVKLDSNDVNCVETYTKYLLYIFIIYITFTYLNYLISVTKKKTIKILFILSSKAVN